ncbi:MAG: TonB-dependent receptor [Opitutales bacterium]|nr:TonB-dependent receptor [Opitutales bacterium]
MSASHMTPHEKTLQINLDTGFYGTLAEIGAGQEVARWFFRAGGASGTVAKTMSAYDMTFSDSIYGPAKRYVSQERLHEMLDHEYALLRNRLRNTRGENTRFFVFADTVAAKGYKTSGPCHAWIGVRFQKEPGGALNDVVIHCHLLDRETLQQQEAVGILGVNLIYAVYALWMDLDAMLESLFDGLGPDRLEIDMFRMSGADLAIHDNRVASLSLVRKGLCKAVLFSPEGAVIQPGDVLYRKPILLERGSFRPVNRLHLDMMRCARDAFMSDFGLSVGDPVEIMEISMHNLLDERGGIDLEDYLNRIDALGAIGRHVMVSDLGEFYKLQQYLVRYTSNSIGIVLGVPLLVELFDEKYYENLAGGILESFGRLFKNRLKLYVYPFSDEGSGLKQARDLELPPHLKYLHLFLMENRHIVDIPNDAVESIPSVSSIRLLEWIHSGSPEWKRYVPEEVVSLIEEKRLFGCPD